jgi:NAD(P)-dependent dehydrogenase (short-subunit alcohol dehydrogenase family)
MATSLAGRVVLVTGASGGIGAATARRLAGEGAGIVAVGRRQEPLERLVADLPGDHHAWLDFDVADTTAWRHRAHELGAVTDVVCAAAVLSPVGEIGTYSPDDFARTVNVNLVGSLCAVHHCRDGLRAASGAVVFFSGGGATAPLPRYDAYAASKAAVVRLAENLAVVLAPEVRVNTVAPGFVATAMHQATLEAGPELAGGDYHQRTVDDLASGGVPPELAAELVALLLSDTGRGVTGRLISAQWDPWREPDFLDRLRDEPHLATLRRIDDVFFTEGPKQ